MDRAAFKIAAVIVGIASLFVTVVYWYMLAEGCALYG